MWNTIIWDLVGLVVFVVLIWCDVRKKQINFWTYAYGVAGGFELLDIVMTILAEKIA